MPLEQLQKLFEEIGQTAERLSRLRGQGDVAFGGRVGRSEQVHSVAELYAQLGRAEFSPLAKPIERLTQQLEKLNERLASQEKRAEAEGVGGPSIWRRLQPHRMLEPLLRFSNYVAAQQAAGHPVDPLVYRLAWASRFFYSFSTGRVVMPSGRATPWRRALAARLRGYRWARPIRQALLAPDIAMRRVRLVWQAAQAGGRSGAAGARAAGAASRLGQLAAAAARTGAGAAAGAAGAAGAGAAGAAGAAAGAAGAGAAGASTGAGAAGAGAAGAAGLAAASIAGVIAGLAAAFVALVAAVIAGTIALGKFVGAVRESASASLEAKRQYAEMVPAMAAILSRKDVLEMQEQARRGRMLTPLAQVELASYQRWTEGTRNLEILGAYMGTAIKIAIQEAILHSPLIILLEQIAKLLNKWLGLQESKVDLFPAVRAMQIMAKGQAEVTMGADFYRWPRSQPPKPINMGPGE